MGNGALPNGQSYRAHPRLYRSGPKYLSLPFSLVCGLATPRQYRCNGNCEIFVAAETFGLTIDVIRDGGKR